MVLVIVTRSHKYAIEASGELVLGIVVAFS